MSQPLASQIHAAPSHAASIVYSMVTQNPSFEHANDARAEHVPASFINQPSKFDILCGRGKLCTENDGNRLYRVVIESFRDSYAQALTKHDKSQVIRHGVYSYLTSISCRFLKFNRSQKAWEELSAEVAHDKIGHALRFANREMKRSGGSGGSGSNANILGAVSSMCLQQIKQHAAAQPSTDCQSATHSTSFPSTATPGPSPNHYMLALSGVQENRMEARTYTGTSSQSITKRVARQDMTIQTRLTGPTSALVDGNSNHQPNVNPKPLQNFSAQGALTAVSGTPVRSFEDLPRETSHHMQGAVPMAAPSSSQCVAPPRNNTTASDGLLDNMMKDWLAATAHDTDDFLGQGALDSNIHALDTPREQARMQIGCEAGANTSGGKALEDHILKHDFHQEAPNNFCFSGQQLFRGSIHN